MSEKELASCNGKIRFETMGMARKVARQQSRRRESALEPYRCVICRGYHIGRKTRMPNAKRDQRNGVEA